MSLVRERDGVQRRRRGWRWLATAVLLTVLLASAGQVWTVWSIPSHLRLLPGQELGFEFGRFIHVMDESATGWLLSRERGVLAVRAGDGGDANIALRLLGVVPVRRVRVSVVPELAVVPGGQAIGVLISAHGLVVGSTMQMMDVEGRLRSPAREAGIGPGDIIAQLAGQDVYSVEQVHDLVDRFGRRGESLEAVVLRHGARLRRLLVPAAINDPSAPDGVSYRIGVTLENPAAGVGTLTFYDARAMRFGGLGHMITDSMNNRLEVNDGRIVEAMIRGIQKGSRGFPGEKIGAFEGDGSPLGVIEKNTEFGIYGVLFRVPRHGLFSEPVPVALAHEVQPGDAQVLTVVDGERVEAFQLRILQVHPQRRQDGRGLVIQITDERLLDRTQGIVQGMSGSPILQDGKLVGAVTHVFVNDPARGYGILAEWMAYEAEILQIISESKQENALPR